MPVSDFDHIRNYDDIRRLSRRKLRELRAITRNAQVQRWADDELRWRETWWTGLRGWVAVLVSLVALGISLANCWAQKLGTLWGVT